MKRAPLLVLADDLTGAAEMAGIGYEHGLDTVLMLDPGLAAPEAELVVYDTNSRLPSPDEAAARVNALLSSLPAELRQSVYKKVDSVLRGPVSSELAAASHNLGRKGVLLCPCNPSRQRIITGGRYFVEGIPLNQTGFASDPLHPAHSDRVEELLRPSPLPVHSLKQGALFPSEGGLGICDASSREEVQRWAESLKPELLPAGGADFFEALLETRGLRRSRQLMPQPKGPHLWLSGSLSPSSQVAREKAKARGLPCSALGPADVTSTGLSREISEAWTEKLANQLSQRGAALVCAEGGHPKGREAASLIRQAFSDAASRLLDQDSFRHLLAEGGDIAAGAAANLGWKRLRVVGCWAPGVVCLSPVGNEARFLTVKPGSYPWPREVDLLLTPS